MATKNMPASTITDASQRWFQVVGPGEPIDDGDALEAVERLLLQHCPTSDLETLVLLEVIAETVRNGGRSDMLEVGAITYIRDRILRESRDAGLGVAFASLHGTSASAETQDSRMSATG